MILSGIILLHFRHFLSSPETIYTVFNDYYPICFPKVFDGWQNLDLQCHTTYFIGISLAMKVVDK